MRVPLGVVAAFWVAAALAFAVSCKQVPAWESGKKFLHFPVRARIGSLDPVRKASVYDNLVRVQVYETLYTYEYLVRPFAIRPLLAAAMPEISADNRTYTIELRRGVYFQDDPCFAHAGGKGRELVAQDVIDSIRRMADRDALPGGFWVYKDRIVGLDDFQRRMNQRQPGQPFDWDTAIGGLRAPGRYTVEIELTQPLPYFIYLLAFHYTSIAPRECAAYYGTEFATHPVGTGPFRLESWVRGSRIVLYKNPTYRKETYPDRASPEFVQRGLDAAAGRSIPFLDGIVFHVYEEDQPMWLKFRVGDLDLVQVPAEYQAAVYDRNLDLRPVFGKDGLESFNLPLLDLVHKGFNMEDAIVGKGERARYLRQAISLALDTVEINQAFYNSAAVLYDGPIPPGLDGYEPGVTSPYRGPDLARARELLAKAGYPGGQGLPVLNCEIARTPALVEQSEMIARQLKKIGIQLAINPNTLPEFQDKLMRKKAQMFALAWTADYPDAENFLQLFYGPNAPPNANNFNYKNPAYDALYDRARAMAPGPERTALYKQMRDILIEDVPMVGSMARTRFYLWQPGLKNVAPDEVWWGWLKYLDVAR